MSGRAADLLARSSLRLALLAGALLLSIVSGVTVAATEPPEDRHVAAARAALEQMPLVDRAAQVVMTSVPGRVLDARTTTALRALRPGGVILFADNYRSRVQLARLDRTLQAAVRAGDRSRPQALVSIDQEGGVVQRIPDAPPTRSHPQLGSIDRLAVTRDQGRRTGVSLRALGIHLDLAPVADLDVEARRVMRARSFGREPVRVGEHVAAFVDGLQAGGMAAAVKHFPGFGGASVNSDDALATITRTRPQLLAADILPFRSAIVAGTEAVMVSHGVYAALDRRRPASMSPATYRLLRTELGFDGVAITDSLHAAGFGAASRLTPPSGCVAAVGAGADIVLLTGPLADAIACRRAILLALRDGSLAQARVDEAVLRVLQLKSRHGLLPTVT